MLPEVHDALDELLKWDCGQPKGNQEAAIAEWTGPTHHLS